MTLSRRQFATTVVLSAPGLAQAQSEGFDWPQWRGPKRNGISAEKDFIAQWPKEGPRRLWAAKVGIGYSSVSGLISTISRRWELDQPQFQQTQWGSTTLPQRPQY